MKLMTKEIEKKLKPLMHYDKTEPKDIPVPLKIFNPYGGGTWFIYEYDPVEKRAFGFVNLIGDDCAELGYISLQELEDFSLAKGTLKLERDKLWDNETKLNDIMDFKVR